MLNYKKKLLYIIFNKLEYYYIHVIIIYYIIQKVNIFRTKKTWKNLFNSIFRSKCFSSSYLNLIIRFLYQ